MKNIPDSVYLQPGLTVQNFSERVKEATGKARRFRVTPDQKARINAGSITREEALNEVIQQKKASTVSV